MTSPIATPTGKGGFFESSSRREGPIFSPPKHFLERRAEQLGEDDESIVQAKVAEAMKEKHERAQEKRNSNLQRRRETVSEHHRKIEEARRAVEGRMAMEAQELLQRHNAKQGGASRRRRMSNERIRLARAAHHKKVTAKRIKVTSSPGRRGGGGDDGNGIDRIHLKLARAERNRRRLHERRQRRAAERFEAGKLRTLGRCPDGDFEEQEGEEERAGEAAEADDDAASAAAAPASRRRPGDNVHRAARQRQVVRLQVLRRSVKSYNSRAAERRARSYAARLIQAWYRCRRAGLPFDATARLVTISPSPSPSPPSSPRRRAAGGVSAAALGGAATGQGLAVALAAAEGAAMGAAAAAGGTPTAPGSPSDAAADSPVSPPRLPLTPVSSEAFDRLAAVAAVNGHLAGSGSTCDGGGGGSDGGGPRSPCSAAEATLELQQLAARRIQALLRRGLHGFKVSNSLLRSTEAVAALAEAAAAMATASYDEAIDVLSGRPLQAQCEAVLRALRMGKEMRHVPPSVRSAKAFLSALLINSFPVTSLDDELPSPRGRASSENSSATAAAAAAAADSHPLALEKARLARAAGNAIDALMHLHATLADVAAPVAAPAAASGAAADGDASSAASAAAAAGGMGVGVADFRRLRRAARGAARSRVAFCLRFAEWKLKDAARLADEMTAACVDVLLMQLRAERDLRAAAVRYGLAEAEDASLFSTGFEQIKEGTSRQLGKMLGALCKLVGREEARRRVDDATEVAFERLAADNPVEEEDTLAAELKALEEMELARAESSGAGRRRRAAAAAAAAVDGPAFAAAAATPPPAVGGGSGSSRKEAPVGGEFNDDVEEDEEEDSAAVGAGGARPLSAGDLLSNEWLVHEVMVSEAPLQVTLEEAHENRLIGDRSSVDDAYWSGVAERFAAGDLTPLLELVADLRDKIVGLTPRRRDLAAETAEAMDVDLLAQMMSHNAFDHGVFFRMVAFAGERILELEAPVRNDATKDKLAAWEKARGDVASGARQLTAELARDCFEFLLGKTDEIHVDILNAHLQFVTPFLKQNGVEYERDRFTEKLDLGEVTLDLTHMWLHRAVRRARRMAAAGDAAATSLLERLERRHGDSYLQLIRAAVVDEVLGSIVRADGPSAAPAAAAGTAAVGAAAAGEDDTIAMPETLAQDQYRLVVIAAAAEQVAYTAAMLAYARQTLAGLKVPLTKPDEDTGRRALMVLFETDDVAGADIAAQVVEIARSGVRKAGKVLPPAAAEALSARVSNVLAEGACAAYRLYLRRVLGLARAVLQASKLDEPAFAGLLKTAGLSEYQEFMIEKVARPLLIIERHNEAVFAPYYNEIIPLALRTTDPATERAHQAAMDID